MCGFITITRRTRDCYSDNRINSAIKAAWEDIAVRGKDAFGAARISENTFAAHSLLSISDPERSQPQPRFSTRSQSAIVYNGEVFAVNGEKWLPTPEHGCDTSFLLEYIDNYGPARLDSVDGMFSLALIQPHTKTIVTARDKYGEKPFFWYQDDELFITSSSAFAISRVIRVMNKPAHIFSSRNIIEYLLFGGCSGHRTVFSQIFAHPTGAYGRLDLETWKYSFGRYWRMPQPLEITNAISFTSKERYLEELKKALSRHIADITPSCDHAVLLSGGVDSALVAHLHPDPRNVTAYTARFNGHNFISEDARATQTAVNARVRLEYVDIDDDSLTESLEQILGQQSYPIDDSSCLMVNLLTHAIGKNHRVCLTGDGADELFFGYTSYTASLDNLGDYANLRFQTMGLARIIVSMLPDRKARDAAEALRQIIDENTMGLCNLDPLAPLVERARQYDINFYMKEIVLAKVDIASMLNNVECRTPFLRKHLSEVALGLPYDVARCISGHNVLKPYLRILLNSIDPSYSIDIPKHGFGAQPELSEKLSTAILRRLRLECAYGSAFSEILRDFYELSDLRVLLTYSSQNIYFGYRMLALSSYINRVFGFLP